MQHITKLRRSGRCPADPTTSLESIQKRDMSSCNPVSSCVSLQIMQHIAKPGPPLEGAAQSGLAAEWHETTATLQQMAAAPGGLPFIVIRTTSGFDPSNGLYSVFSGL